MNAAEQAAQIIVAMCELFRDDMPCVPIMQSAFEQVIDFHDEWCSEDTPPLERDEVIACLIKNNDWLTIKDLA